MSNQKKHCVIRVAKIASCVLGVVQVLSCRSLFIFLTYNEDGLEQIYVDWTSTAVLKGANHTGKGSG